MNIRSSSLQPLKRTPNIRVCCAFVIPSSLYIPPLVSIEVRVEVSLRLAVYRQSVRLGVKPLETYDQRSFFLTESLW
jgi:hypothetical protein